MRGRGEGGGGGGEEGGGEGEEWGELSVIYFSSWRGCFVHVHTFLWPCDDTHSLSLSCSAGVGRTGTLITIQAMMHMIEDEGQVDIFNFILGMRRQRSYMVQTEVCASSHMTIT